MILTEFPVYQELGRVMALPRFSHSLRSIIILIYSLCGFAHIPSMAIFVGGLTALVPDRKKDIAGMAFRALIAATLACLMTGAVAGVFYSGQDLILSLP